MEKGMMEEDIPDEVFLEATIQFANHFSDYIKEWNHDVWRRAVDYAKSYTELEDFDIFYGDDKRD
tara:strand:+ start:4792 stop:4986 length:195 start_codon:yes stop_codon:yes gene_type:complete